MKNARNGRTIASAVVTALLVCAIAVVGTSAAEGPSAGQVAASGSTLAATTAVVTEWLAIVGAVATTAAVVGGGIFAWRNSQIFRAKSPHVVITHEVSHRLVGTQYVHIFVTAVLHNSSRVHIEFLDGFARIRQVKPLSDADIERLYDQVFVQEEHGSFQWFDLDVLSHHWDQDGLLVEPGETETEIFDFVVRRDVESVAVSTYFYNARVVGRVKSDSDLVQVCRRRDKLRPWRRVRGPLGWGRTTVYDIVNPEPPDAEHAHSAH